MRQLSFRGFLKAYVAGLSGRRTTSLSELTSLVDSNKRLREPLVLWAVENEKSEILFKLMVNDPRAQAELLRFSRLKQAGKLEESLSQDNSDVRQEYLKVWRSYVTRRDAYLRDERLKFEVRKRVLALESSRHVTRYRMAKALGLNQGNLHAFLSQGDLSKLSLQRAYDLVDFLESSELRDHDSEQAPHCA